MATVEEATASFERNIAAQTGKPVADWVATVAAQGVTKHGAIVAWLKAEHALSHAHANHIAKRATAAASPPTDDPASHLFDGGKTAMRPVYDRLVAEVVRFGTDVEVAPKKANTSLRRRRQFALIQPSTRSRVDLGLILRDRASAGRLEPSGSFNAMFTHRVKLASVADIDAEVLAWLRDAYDGAA